MVYIALTLAMGLAGVATYLFFLRRGQFDNSEEVKYQLFRDEEKSQ